MYFSDQEVRLLELYFKLSPERRRTALDYARFLYEEDQKERVEREKNPPKKRKAAKAAMTLKALSDSLGIVPRRVAEIAAGWPEFSYMADYIYAGVPTILVEPQQAMIEHLREAFGHYPHVEILQKLITPDGLYRRMVRPSFNDPRGYAQTAYVEGTYAPILNQAAPVALPFPDDTITRGADCCTMSMIDPGDIDVLNLDIEGSEWLVLSTMASRPRLIHIEVYGAYGYTNPDLPKIETWMGFNGYHEIEHPNLKDAGQNRVYAK